MTPSQSPLGLKYHSFILLQFCRSDVKSVSPNPFHRVQVKVLAGLVPSRGDSISLSFLASGGPCILSRRLFLTSSSLLFHRLLPTLAPSYKNASDHM